MLIEEREFIECIAQRSPNYPVCQSSPLPNFVNEVLLKQSQVCHLPIVYSCFHIIHIVMDCRA